MIGIDAVFFQQSDLSGIARLWRSLLAEWSRDDFAGRLVVFDRNGTCPKFEGLRYVPLPECCYSNIVADRYILENACRNEGVRLFVSSYYTTPVATPSVFVAYDMIPEALGWPPAPVWDCKREAIRHADTFISISHGTAADLASYYGVGSTVVHCGVDHAAFFPDPSPTAEPLWLTVGITDSNRYYKNLSVVTDVMPFFGHDLLNVGQCKGVRWLRSVPDETLRRLYSNALALIYPSSYEGFGLPVLEAMACGCPVVASLAVREAAGEAALYFDGSPAEALGRVLDLGVRESLRQAGLVRAGGFSWARTAAEIRALLLSRLRRK